MSEHEWNLELLQERLAELELALLADGWMRMGQQFEREFSRESLGQIAYLARLMYLKNPLLRRSVDVQAFYVFGQGVTISHKDTAVNAVVQAFLDDAGNRGVLTSNQALLGQERQLQLEGNLFICFFADLLTGRVRARTMPLGEIVEIVTDPEDAATPWFYCRQWTQQGRDLATGMATTETQRAWYPDWRYRPTAKPASIGSDPVRWETPVMHVRAGGLVDMQFGVPEVYPQIDWARAYKEFLEDWATLTRAYSRFAHKLTVQGGARGVAAAKSKLGTTYAGGSTLASESNPPPVVGSTFIGAEGVDLQTMRIGGANVSMEDGRRLLLMVAAAAGLPETFYGDASVGALATAKSLDRPTELKFKARQTLWSDVLRDVLHYVISVAVRAGVLPGQVIPEPDGTPRVALAGEVDPAPLIEFPPLLEHDVTETVSAIISAATLDGKASAGTMDDETLIRLLLGALGVQDADGVLKRLEKEEGEGDMDGVDGMDGMDEPEEDEEGAAGQEEERTAEALMVAAVRELRGAVARLVESEA
jgi:hypothetical protein